MSTTNQSQDFRQPAVKPFRIKDPSQHTNNSHQPLHQSPIQMPKLLLMPHNENFPMSGQQDSSQQFHHQQLNTDRPQTDNSQFLYRRFSRSGQKQGQQPKAETIEKLNFTHKKLIEDIITRNSKKASGMHIQEGLMHPNETSSSGRFNEKSYGNYTQRNKSTDGINNSYTQHKQNTVQQQLKKKQEELAAKSASRNQKTIIKDLSQIYEKTISKNKPFNNTSQSPTDFLKQMQRQFDKDYLNYSGRQKQIDQKFKQFFHLNQTEHDHKHMNSKSLISGNPNHTFSNDLANVLDLVDNASNTITPIKGNTHNQQPQSSRNHQQLIHHNSNKRMVATSQIQARNRLTKYERVVEKNVFDPEMLERDQELRKQNLKYYEDLVGQTFKKPPKTAKTHKSVEKQSSFMNAETQFMDENLKLLIEDYGNLFFLQKENSKVLEKQLIRFAKFQIDFGITRNTAQESIKQFFNQNSLHKGDNNDSSYDSKDSYQRKQRERKNLQQNFRKFENLRNKVEGMTFPLVSYLKDIEKGTTAMKQEESLKKRVGLIDFLSELNDCQKNLLRFMMEQSPDNCFAIYCIDFIWKMMLVRFEFHLDDEEQRLLKIQRYYEQQLKKETAEIQFNIKSKEEQYKQTIFKLERIREDLMGRVDKLLVDKNQLLDTVQDKEDELRVMRDPRGVSKFGNLQTELDFYMKDMNMRRKEQSLAVKGLKVFLDQVGGSPTRQSQILDDKKMSGSQAFDGANEQSSILMDMKKNRSGLVDSSNTSDDESIKKLKVTLGQRVPRDSQENTDKMSSSSSEENSLVKLNKSKSRPSYRVLDEGLLAPQLIISQSLNKAKNNNIQLLPSGTLLNMTNQTSGGGRIKRTKDVQLQTDEDVDFICSKCLIRAQMEEDKNDQKEDENGDKGDNEVKDVPSRKESLSKQEQSILKLQRISSIKSTNKSQGKSLSSSSFMNNLKNDSSMMNRQQSLMGGVKQSVQLVDLLDANSKEVVIMPEQTLLKHIEEILEKKFESDEKASQQIKVSNTQLNQIHNFQVNQSPQDILTFAYNHFLAQQGLKSLSIRYLNSIYGGIKKIYSKAPQDNQYAQFLIQIFGFCPEEFPAFRPDQARISLKVRHLFQIVQRNLNQMNQRKNIATKIVTRLTDGGRINLAELIPMLFKTCKNQSKGLFSNFINKLHISEVYYPEIFTNSQIQRHFIQFKILCLIQYSKIDLQTLAMRTENRELQMDSVIMRLEEILEFKINHQELAVFKKEFDNFFLVPIKTVEKKISLYLGEERIPNLNFEISLLVLMNKVLEEWELFQNSQRKKLLKKFIDFDANGDGVLTLDEFRELMKNVEGMNIPNERVITLFTEALEMSSQEFNDDALGFSDKMSPQCFVETMMRNRIGGYGYDFLDFEFVKENDKSNKNKDDKQSLDNFD